MGTRTILQLQLPLRKDHPHACGDKELLLLLLLLLLGSSPRVWGQVMKEQGSAALRRIIPTRVGTRLIRKTERRHFVDHPHACGDKSHHFEVFQRRLGSSPRVWGQVSNIYDLLTRSRIIPTRVGTSSLFFISVFTMLGSSPRVWGQVLNRH